MEKIIGAVFGMVACLVILTATSDAIGIDLFHRSRDVSPSRQLKMVLGNNYSWPGASMESREMEGIKDILKSKESFLPRRPTKRAVIRQDSTFDQCSKMHVLSKTMGLVKDYNERYIGLEAGYTIARRNHVELLFSDSEMSRSSHIKGAYIIAPSAYRTQVTCRREGSGQWEEVAVMGGVPCLTYDVSHCLDSQTKDVTIRLNPPCQSCIESWFLFARFYV